jgi:hypothetical protein
MIGNAGVIYTEVVEQFFAMASILAGDYTDLVECRYGPRYHISEIAYGCGDYI